MKRLFIWWEPSRWLGADMQRDAYLRLALISLCVAAIATGVAITLGIAWT